MFWLNKTRRAVLIEFPLVHYNPAVPVHMYIQSESDGRRQRGMEMAFPFEWAAGLEVETSWMRLKLSALLGCGVWEKGFSVTNPVHFVAVWGGEHLAWHQMPLNGCFSKQDNMAAPPCSLFPAWQAHLNPSGLSYICQEHGFYLTPLPWFQLLYRVRTCVYFIYYGMLRREGTLERRCHIQVCESLCVLNAGGSCVLLFSGIRREQEAIRWDGHHDSDSHWTDVLWTLSDRGRVNYCVWRLLVRTTAWDKKCPLELID